MARLPLAFEPNAGQAANEYDYFARGHGYQVFLSAGEAVLNVGRGGQQRPDVLRMRILGSSRGSRPAGKEALPGRVNYYVGSDSSKWVRNIPTFGKVEYSSVYRGIDVVYYGNERQLEYDFVVHPGARPSAISVQFEGARQVRLDAAGDLLIEMAGGAIRQHRPRIYQEVGGARKEVAGGYRIMSRGRVGFEVGEYDRTRPLLIDPLIKVLYSVTFGGAASSDRVFGLEIDDQGNAYVAGATDLPDFPGVPAGTHYGPPVASIWAFVAKLNPSGAVMWSTVFGGSATAAAREVALAGGSLFAVGVTTINGFPGTPIQYGPTGNEDAFLVKMDPASGSIQSSALFGGTANDQAIGMAVRGQTIAVSGACGNGFPVASPAFQTQYGGGTTDGFVAFFDTSLNLQASTYVGGSSDDSVAAVAFDNAGNVYLAGGTQSSNFPLQNAAYRTYRGLSDGFVLKLNAAKEMEWSTYLGGAEADGAASLAIDAGANVIVAGTTSSADFPVLNAFQAQHGVGGPDAFVTKIAPSGTLAFSTFLGGYDYDYGNAVAVDASGAIYVAGSTLSPDFPLLGSLNPAPTAEDAFVARLSSDGKALLGSTVLGAASDDDVRAVRADGSGNVFVAGRWFVGYEDAWVAKLKFPTTIVSDFNSSSIPEKRYLWFNSNVTFSGVPTAGAVIRFEDVIVRFADKGVVYQFAVPNGQVTVLPSTTGCASTVWNGAEWNTTTPRTNLPVFITGLSWDLPDPLKGGVQPVVWAGRITATAPDIDVTWRWSAAEYKQLGGHGSLNVKAIDGAGDCQYGGNTDSAGTPEAYKQYVNVGGRSNGAPNYTGTFTPSVTVRADN